MTELVLIFFYVLENSKSIIRKQVDKKKFRISKVMLLRLGTDHKSTGFLYLKFKFLLIFN